MTEAVVSIVPQYGATAGVQTVRAVLTTVFVGGDTGGGITQTQADARYIRLSQINAANGVPSIDADKYIDESRLPLPAVDLSILLANKLA